MMEREWIITDGEFSGTIVWVINFESAGKNVVCYCVDPINSSFYRINWEHIIMCTEANRGWTEELIKEKKKRKE